MRTPPQVQRRQGRRVVMFTYYFPPFGGSAIQRNLKFAKYLPEHGFDPIVIAGRPNWFRMRDESLSADIPPRAQVIHAGTIPLHFAQWKLDGLFRRLGLPTRLVRQALFPDMLVGWVPSAVWHALRVVREQQPDALYSSYLPGTSHLAALIVHRLTGLPWVADFRDAWALNPGPEKHTDYHPSPRAVAAFERTVTEKAAYTTVACDSIDLVGVRRGNPRRVVIPNGVDEDDLASARRSNGAGGTRKLRLSYVGSLWGNHDAAPIFDAVRGLIADGTLDPEHFELRLVGNISLAPERLQSLPVSVTGYVDHRRAVEEMMEASILLFSLPAGYPGASSKIYEYLSSGRPVLCVADPDNVAFRLVHELRAGKCADVNEPLAVKQALSEMVGEWRRGGLGVDPSVPHEALRRFSRRKLAGDLAQLLETAASER